MGAQYCPICKVEVSMNPRYPRYVCGACCRKAGDLAGNKLVFYNVDLSGGFVAKYVDNGDVYGSNVCYIDGVKCWADEARFGGIVIEVMEDISKKSERLG